MTAYHYWQNQPGCSPNDIPTLPTRARHVSWLRQGLTPKHSTHHHTFVKSWRGESSTAYKDFQRPHTQSFTYASSHMHQFGRRGSYVSVLLCLLRPSRTHLKLRHNLPTPVNGSSKTWSSERNAPHLVYCLPPLTGRKSC